MVNDQTMTSDKGDSQPLDRTSAKEILRLVFDSLPPQEQNRLFAELTIQRVLHA